MSLAATTRTAIASGAVLTALCFTPGAHALGLGNINVLSGLNQPLRAVVPLLLEEDETADQISLNIAGDAEAVKLGALPNLLGQDVEVVISLQGDRTEALITTDFPVKEPHLDVVLRARLGETKHLRVYPVLLDLPIAFFEPDNDDSYLEENITARTNWDGKPSEQQRDQMNEPADVASLDVDGEASTPIKVGSVPPTGYEDPFEETVTYIAEREDDAALAREIDDNEISAAQLTHGAQTIGVDHDAASELSIAFEDTADIADTEVGDDVGAVLPQFESSGEVTEATTDDVLPAVAEQDVAATMATESGAEDELEPVASAVSNSKFDLQTAAVDYPQVTPTVAVTAPDPAAAMPAETDAPRIDLATWASTEAQLPLPEAVLLAEVPDDIGAPVSELPLPRAAALTRNQAERSGI